MNNNINKRQRSGNTGCCVVFCHNTYGKTKDTKFYSFPSRPHLLERRQKWINAVNRINSDGSPWQPTSNSKICSNHFLGGNKSEDPRLPAYNPTIFPIEYKRKESSNINLDRFKRWKKRKSESKYPSIIISNENLCEDIRFSTNINKTQNKYNKSVQVTSLEQIDDNFIFSCDFDRESNSISTQATITSHNILKKYVFTKDKSSGPNTPILLSGFRGYNSIKNDKQLMAFGARRLKLNSVPTKFSRQSEMSSHEKLMELNFNHNDLGMDLMDNTKYKDLSESEEEEMSNRSSDLPPMSIKTEIDPELDPLKIKCSSENSTSNNKERLNGSEEEEETSNRFPLPLPITPVTIKIEKDSELDPFDPSGYSQNEASNTKQEQDSRTRKRKLSSNSNSISNDNLAVVSPKIKSTDDADDDYDTFGKLIAFQLRELAHYNGRICQEKILSLIKEEQRLLHLSSSQEKIGTKIKQEPFEFIKTEICSDTSEEF